MNPESAPTLASIKNEPAPRGKHAHSNLHLPAPTAWPIYLALGLNLIFTSLVTSPALAMLGLVLAAAGAVGWFREVLPNEAHIFYPVDGDIVPIDPSPSKVARIDVGETHRAQLPLHTFPISSGLKGGIAGGIAMVIPAEIYSLIRYHSVWYVINLLGGAGVGDWINPTIQQMSHFRLSAFIFANIIQGSITLLVGVLYGVLLPIWPKRPILLGGIVAPVLWTGLLYGVIGIINPYFLNHIDWWSFAASQIVFGLVAGYVVTRIGHLRKLAQIPLAARIGIETPGLEGKEPKQ